MLIYVLLCGLFYAYQGNLLFRPRALPANHVYAFPVKGGFTTATIPYDQNTSIDVVQFRSDDTSAKPKGVVLFFHGNRNNIAHYSHYAPIFTRHGYEVWMPDYPGYGRSTGEIEDGMLQDLSIQLYQMARSRFAPVQIVVYGKSLGSGIAAYLASERDCRQLILETPYYSLSSLAQHYAWFLPVPLLMRFTLNTGEYLTDVTAPVTAFVAGKDEVVPIANSMKLLGRLKPNDGFRVFEQEKHNGIPENRGYLLAMDSILKN